MSLRLNTGCEKNRSGYARTRGIRLRIAKGVVRHGFSAHGVLFPAKRPGCEADACTARACRNAAQGHSPGAVRRLRPFPARRHRFCLPAVSRGRFPVASPVRGSVPGPSSPGRLPGRPSSEFKSVKIVFSLRFVQAPTVVRTARSRLRPPCPLRFRRVQGQFVRQVPPPSVVPVYHPVPASCSARLPFVSFMVRISVRFVFVSVRFQLVSLQLVSAWSCSVRSCLFPFILPFCSFQFGFSVRLSLILCVCARSQAIYLYISRVYYTLDSPKFKCIFSRKTCVF